MACAVFERISGLEPSSKRTALRYMKLLTVPSFCPLPLFLDVYRQFGRLGTDLNLIACASFVETFYCGF